MSGILYVVSTPIGNLADISERAKAVLAEVSAVAAEDTRRTGLLLDAYGIQTRLISYHDHNEQERTPQLVKRLQQGESLALVSDAGTPLVSDPGYRLVRACQEAEIQVVPVPGASAVLAALAVAGLPTDEFIFLGFLPAKGKARLDVLQQCIDSSCTSVIFEAPHRLVALLEQFVEAGAGQREITLCRELTKNFETVRRTSVEELLVWVREDSNQQRGEIVLVVAGGPKQQFANNQWQPLAKQLLRELPAAKVAKVLADFTGEKRQVLYQWLLEQDKAGR